MILKKTFIAALITIIPALLSVIIPLAPAYAAPSIKIDLSASYGPPGTTLIVSGTGFSPGNYNVIFANSVVSTMVVGASAVPAGGTVSNWFPVPVYPRGNYFIMVVDSAADVFSTPTFTIIPQIFLSSSTGGAGDQVTVSGNGFTANSNINMYFDGVVQTPASALIADSFGQFNNAVFTIPPGGNGPHTITAGDSAGVCGGVTYTLTPRMTLSTGTGTTGSSIAVSGTGFTANSALSFFLDSAAIKGINATTGANGSFTNVTIHIPTISGGVHTLKTQDAAGNFVNANVTVNAIMTISPASGTVDTTIAITGKGFLASAPVTVNYDGATVTGISGLLSTADGIVSGNFKVPLSAAGEHVITVSDGTNTMSAAFQSLSSAAISVSSGPVGTSVNISGTGFKTAGNITITYNDSPAGTAAAAVNGSFSTMLIIPPASTGSHSLLVSDGINSQTFTFCVTPAAAISPAFPTVGNVGSLITINGTGYGASKDITVTWDSNLITLTSPGATDAKGTFSAFFKAPAGMAGNHIVIVSDGASSQTFTFVMDSTAPAVPTPYLPASAATLPEIPVFTWSGVTDPSGVIYNLQISRDATFQTIELEKKGLISPSYILTEQDKLKSTAKNEPYYWRVQAVDTANNAAAWTAPQTFWAGAASTDYSVYIICGSIALILGILGFVIGRLTRRRVISVTSRNG